MTNLSQRIIETQQALTEAEAQANRPAQLAAELAELQAQQAAEQAKFRQALQHYNEIIAPKHQADAEALRRQRAELREQYAKVQSLLTEMITQVQAYEQQAHAFVASSAAEEAAVAWLQLGRSSSDFVVNALYGVSFTQEDKAMLDLLSLVYSAEALHKFASNEIRPVINLAPYALGVKRNLHAYVARVLDQLPDPKQTAASWGA